MSQLRERVLVPLQGRRLDHPMIELLTLGWVPAGHEVVLVVVVEPEPDPAEQALLLQEARDRLDALRDALLARGVSVSARVVVGDHDDELVELVERLAPAFVLVAEDGGLDPAARFAERVGHRCRAPVLVTHARPTAETRLRSVLVRLDGTDSDLRALPLVGRLARLHGAEVLLVRPEWDESDEVTKLRSPLEVEAELEPARRDLERCCGVRARTVVVYGPDAPQLLAVAENEDVDLVVVSTRGRISGSPAEQVLLHSARPLLVFRGPSGPTEAPTGSRCALIDERGGRTCPFEQSL